MAVLPEKDKMKRLYNIIVYYVTGVSNLVLTYSWYIVGL